MNQIVKSSSTTVKENADPNAVQQDTGKTDQSSKAMPSLSVDAIAMGRMVEVASRTWPGINQPGGVARVTKVHFEEPNDEAHASDANQYVSLRLPTHVDVAYIVGRSKEKRVPIEYVRLAPEYESQPTLVAGTSTTPRMSSGGVASCQAISSSSNNQIGAGFSRLRDRSLLLGRCRRCGSLRTDCGSCDWATEENEQERQAQNQQNQIYSDTNVSGKPTDSVFRHRNKSKRIKRRKNREKRNGKPSRPTLALLSSSSSEDSASSEDEEMENLALQELLDVSRRRYRKHVRERKKWEASYGQKQEENESPKEQQTQKRRREDQRLVSSTPDSTSRGVSEDEMMTTENFYVTDEGEGDDDDDLDELLQESQHRYQQHIRRRAKWQRRMELPLDSTVAEVSSPRYRRRRELHCTHRSVLETLNGATSSSLAGPSESGQKTLSSDHRERRQNEQDDSMILCNSPLADGPGGISENIIPNTTTETDMNQNLKKCIDTPTRAGSEKNADFSIDLKHSPNGIPDSLSPESLREASLEDYLAVHIPTRRELSPNSLAERFDEDPNSQLNASPLGTHGNTSSILALSDFIQPEGTEAAENLPKDTVDRTKSIPYHELPKFFSRMVGRLEDELIPNFRLRIAQIQRKHSRLLRTSRQTYLTSQANDQDVDDPRRLLKEVEQVWAKVTQQLIRNGTDQCRSALRLLADRRIYRMHRSQLTTKQRKEIRGTMLMDARNLRLDSLEDIVEDVIRSLKDVAYSCEDLEAQQFKRDDREGGHYDSEDAHAQIDSSEPGEDCDYDTQDLIPLQDISTRNEHGGNAMLLDPCERALQAFDPHQHATKRKNNDHSSSEALRFEVQKSENSQTCEKNRKKAKRSHSGTVGNYSSSLSKRVLLQGTRKNSVRSRPSWNHQNVKLSNSNATRKRSSEKSSIKDGNKSRERIPSLYTNEDETIDIASVDDGSEVISVEETHGNIESSIFVLEEAADDNTQNLDSFIPGGNNSFDDIALNRRKVSRARKGSRQRSILEYSRDHLAPENIFANVHRKQRDRAPISERMQEFLDKNQQFELQEESIRDIRSSEQTPGARIEVRGHRAHRMASRYRDSQTVDFGENSPKYGTNTQRGGSGQFLLESGERGGSDANDIGGDEQTLREEYLNLHSTEKTNHFISTEDLLAKLHYPCNMAPAMANNEPGASTSALPALSSELQRIYASEPMRAVRLLRKVKSILMIESSHDIISRSTISKTFLNLLKCHGSQTLLELISTKSQKLEAHVELLSAFVSFGDEKHEESGFREQFLQLVVLQLIDAMYAVLHPGAWAQLKMHNRRYILQLLEPLRNALAKALPLTEFVSYCIINTLECQKWRIDHSQSQQFVSSMDPKVWDRFLESAVSSYKAKDSRYSKLGKMWPRVEVEATWNMLLFFGAPKSLQDEQRQARWQLISKLFSSCVLANSSDEDDMRLPPCEKHLAALASDMYNLEQLLRKGSLNDIPSSDKLVITLVKKAICFQADDYIGNEQSRLGCYPTFDDSKAWSKLVSRLWKITHPRFLEDKSQLQCTYNTVFDLKLKNSIDTEWSPKLKDLLLPSSPLLRRSLSLLLSWIQRVPRKKVRLLRFNKQLTILRENLVELSSKMVKTTPAHEVKNNAFGDVFGETLNPHIGDAKERTATYLREAVAQLHILQLISSDSNHGCSDGRPMTAGISFGAMQDIWSMVATDEMKEKRESLLRNDDPVLSFSGDAFLVYTAARVMSTVALVCMDVAPWYLGTGCIQNRLSLNVEEHHEMIDYYAFPISCVLVCLEILRSLGSSPKLLSNTMTLVTVIFNRLTLLVRLDGTRPSINRVALQTSSLYIPIMQRCFKFQVNATGDKADRLLIRLVLCALRGLSTFQATRQQAQEEMDKSNSEISQLSNSADGDPMDDLDDSFFDCIDLDNITSSMQAHSASEVPLWRLLSRSLEMLKPSERFKISQSTSKDEILQISPHAKFILTKDAERLCDCLVAIVASEVESDLSSDFWKKLSNLLQPKRDGTSDAEFEARISRRMCAELCSLTSTYTMCQHFVSKNAEIFLCGAAGALIDCDRLELFPSCNFDLFRKSDKSAAREALASLDLFNGTTIFRPGEILPEAIESVMESQSRRRERAKSAWEVVERLGDALSAEHSVLGTILKEIDTDILRKHRTSFQSDCLEKEVFACFRFLRGVLSVLSRDNVPLFEKASSFIVSSVSLQMLRLVSSLRYQDQANEGERRIEKEAMLRRARTSSLLAAISEFFIAMTTWILREQPDSVSPTFGVFATELRERLFYPVLRRQHVDMTCNLKYIVEASRGLSGAKPNGRVPVTGISGCSGYFQELFLSCLRRSSQLLTAPCNETHAIIMQNCLIEAGTVTNAELESEVAEIIGKSFVVEKTDLKLASGPLEAEIDQYLQLVEQEIPRHKQIHNLASMRISMMKTIITPRIRQKKASLLMKRRVLRITTHMLPYMNDDRQDSLALEQNVIECLCSLLRAIRVAIFQALSATKVDDELLKAALACVAATTTIPKRRHTMETATSSTELDADDLTACNLISWCRDLVMGKVFAIDFETEVDACGAFAAYLVAFVHWLYHLAQAIAFATRQQQQQQSSYQISVNEDWSELRQFCSRPDGFHREECDNDSSSASQLPQLLGSLIGSPVNQEENWPVSMEQLLICTRAIMRLEIKLFFKNPRSGLAGRGTGPPAVNVYAKDPRNTSGNNASNCYTGMNGMESNHSMETWEPNLSTQRSAKEYIAAVIVAM